MTVLAEERPKSNFAVLSMWTFVAALVATFLVIGYIHEIAAGDRMALVGTSLALSTFSRPAFFIIYMIGVIFAAVSLVKQEPQKVKATVFGLLNLFSLAAFSSSSPPHDTQTKRKPLLGPLRASETPLH